MLSFSGAIRVYVAVEPCDMRKGFNGLEALARERLEEDPRNGALYVFTNRCRTRLMELIYRTSHDSCHKHPSLIESRGA